MLGVVDLANIPESWVQIAVIAAGWVVTVAKIDGRLQNVEKDIKYVSDLTRWRERIEERLVILRRDIDEMRHLRGFVTAEAPESVERWLRQERDECIKDER